MSHVDNDIFYQRIRASDKAAIDEMIRGNLPLVKSRVGEFLKDYRRFRHLFDDLYGEGILALTQVVKSFAESEADKPTSYIISKIDYALKNYVDAEIGAGFLNRNQVQYRRSRDQSLPNQLPIDVANPPTRIWQNATGRVVGKNIEQELPSGEIQDTEIPPSEFGLPNEFEFGKEKKRVSHTDAEQIISRYKQSDAQSDLLDQILASCESDEEKEIVLLRIDGYTDAEIGERLGISRQTVNRRRKEIEDRFNSRG